MKAVLQRVTSASVEVDKQVVGQIESGLMILFGAIEGDSEQLIPLLAKKTAELRIFADDNGKMNRSLVDIGGAALVVSQFTLAADCKKGRRPSFNKACRPEFARELYEKFCEALKGFGIRTQTGRFGATMKVALVNDGHVTIVLDSDELKPQK